MELQKYHSGSLCFFLYFLDIPLGLSSYRFYFPKCYSICPITIHSPNFPIIRDLVTDFSRFFNHHKNMKPYIQENNAVEAKDDTNKGTFSFYQSPEDVDKYLQFSYCIKCGLCYSACPTVGTDVNFPGPQALAQEYRYFADTRDESKNRLNIVDDRHGIWRCHFAGSCSKVCPKGVDPALGIQLLRSYMLGISKNNKVPAKKIQIDNDNNDNNDNNTNNISKDTE